MSLPFSPAQFGHNDRPNHALPTRKVRLDRLVATQNDFDVDKVLDIARKDPDSFRTVPIVGRRDDGSYLIGDGHHRVAAALALGHRTINVRIAQ